MKGLFKRLLNVKGMVVEDVSIDDSPLRPAPVLVVRVRRGRGELRCSRCGRKCPKYDDGGGERRWRHQDFDCYGVELMGLAPRVACAEHGVVVAQVPWAEPGSRFTRDFEMECAWLTAVASRKTVGGFLRIAWRTAGDIARRVAARLGSSMPCMFDGLTAIGVDETSYRKGRTYITVVVDHKRKRVVWAHDGYGKEVLDLFFRQLTDEQRASIKAVTGDGAKWIDASVKEHLPNAERVLDSFHIVSWMTDTLDQVRKRLWNQDRRGNDKTATETMKGLKYAVLKNPGDLTERQSGALETLRDTDPRGQLYRSWQLKELLRTLPHQPVGQAEAELKRWIFRASHSRIPEVVELCRKIRRRRDDILGTIGPGYSNARLEAFNNKIKVTIRMAYGFRHADNLIAMIKLRYSGLPTHLPTPIL
ncbi:ISL3 family transposase [Bifidobacterium breve]|uniref:ISL3 family transposase n=1 Tax=Bifidobacterium breve TaxID=1685 RepID=UPI0029C42FCE|nr:ISL3 family transposase [Bifidobacterium breve]MDX5141894.1 ISL3 family transposase [Bifidobacterium breve]